MTIKTRKCISCGNLTDNAGELFCERCKIIHPKPPRKHKVLIIDDDVNIVKELKEKLESTLYFEIVSAYDGRKGLEKLGYEKPLPELILVDLNMPMMNGYEFVEQLRCHEDDDIRGLPVIVLSEKEKMNKFFQSWDIQGFFKKPVDLKQLFLLMKDLAQPD